MNETLTWADLQDCGNAQAQLILLAIARSADWISGEGYPDIKTIAKRAKCSERTASTYLKRLAADEFIRRIPRKRADGGRTSDMIILVGYSEWYHAIYKGGTVSAPRSIKRYDTPMQDLHGGVENSVDQEAEIAAPPMQVLLHTPHATTFAGPKNVKLTSDSNVSADGRASEGARPPAPKKHLPQFTLTPADSSWDHWMTWLTDHDHREVALAAQEARQLVTVARWPKPGTPVPRVDGWPLIEKRKRGDAA
jgi:hypothetical protein